jgi:hypothetical protein
LAACGGQRNLDCAGKPGGRRDVRLAMPLNNRDVPLFEAAGSFDDGWDRSRIDLGERKACKGVPGLDCVSPGKGSNVGTYRYRFSTRLRSSRRVRGVA